MSAHSVSSLRGLSSVTAALSQVDSTESFKITSLTSLLSSLVIWPVRLILRTFLIKIPTLALQLLSTRFSITLSFSTVLMIFGACFVTSFFIIRYKVLTKYSKAIDSSPNPPLTTSSASLLSGSNDQGKRRYPGSYIDEFLIAIKIFGYLEKPVFNELTKQMRTQKITRDEFIAMDEHLGFAIVVEGNVQIYSKVGVSSHHDNTKTDADDFSAAPLNIDDDIVKPETLLLNGEKYQLLNEVKTGNPLSSLVNILTLFTEDDNSGPETPQAVSKLFSNSYHSNVNISRGQYSTDHIAPLDLNNTNSSKVSNLADSVEPQEKQQTPSIIARATKDSTIAIIPAGAFQRLRKKHPRASSHIVQMILTRLYRVTFQTAHNYLGLTKEIFSSEITLNREVERLHNDVNDVRIKNWLTSNSSKPENITSSSSLSKQTSISSGQKSTSAKSLKKSSIIRPNARRSESKHIVLNHSLHDLNSNPGDLLSNVPLSSPSVNGVPVAGHVYPTPSDESFLLSGDEDSEDVGQTSWILKESQEDLKSLIVEGMFRFLGVNRESLSARKSSGSSTGIASILNSPAGLGGFQTFNIIDSSSIEPDLSKNGSFRQRTFSSASLTSSSNLVDDSLDDSLNYDNAKDEFFQKVQVLNVGPGQVLVEQNTSFSKSNGLFYVISGELEVIYNDESKSIKHTDTKSNSNDFTSKQIKAPSTSEHLVYKVKSGGVAGYLGSVVGSKLLFSIRSSSDHPCVVGFLSKFDLERLCEKFFMIYLSIAKALVESLSAKLLKLDSALEWVQIDAGETLFKQETNSNGIYVVLNGRLRSIREDQNSTDLKILKEYGQGESFGEVEVLTAVKRSSTFVAVRDSELARIPRSLFEILALENPGMMIRMSRIVAERIKKEQKDQLIENYYNIPSTGSSNFPNLNKNYRTITILPTTSGLPVMEFSNRLIQAFQDVKKSVIGLDQAMTLNILGRYAFDKLFNLRQNGFFSDLEEKYDITCYIADTSVSSTWTSTCIQQGDCILLLADSDYGDPSIIGEYERLLLKSKTTARVELIMLHQEKYVPPGLVSNWLKNRVWVDSHHHIQLNHHRINSNLPNPSVNIPSVFLNNNLNILANTLKESVESFRSKYGISQTRQKTAPLIPHYKNDFMRLARILSGQAVGIILGGGGARGFSHLGVLGALEENGIPIDLIGGTSIGSFIGGLYAQDYELVSIYGRAKKFAGRIGSIWRTLFDLTLPLTSYTTGHEFNRGLWKIFGDSRIEDFWISFFCNSTNITNSCMEVHSTGYAWRFVRASMTLAGLLPPLAHNGSMLLDGGYVDNLPVDEMKRRGASIIFAVDVGSVDDRTPMNYGDSLSGAWCFWNKLNPFSKHPNVPTLSEIQMRLCYVSSVNALERAKESNGIIYLRPPVENYGTLDFSKFEEIYKVGSAYGHTALKELIDDHKLPEIAGMNVDLKKVKGVQRRNSI